MAQARPRPGAVRSVAQLLVVVAGGTAIGALLVLLAFPDAIPVGAPILLAGAGVLAVVTSVAAFRLGRATTPARRPAKTGNTAKKPAKRKSTTKKKTAKKTSKKTSKKKTAKKAEGRRKPAQGRARR